MAMETLIISVVLIKVSYSSKTIWLEKTSEHPRNQEEEARRMQEEARRRQEEKEETQQLGGHSKHFVQNKINEFDILIRTKFLKILEYI